MRIAMWFGPRNLSLAMMYTIGNRGDCGWRINRFMRLTCR